MKLWSPHLMIFSGANFCLVFRGLIFRASLLSLAAIAFATSILPGTSTSARILCWMYGWLHCQRRSPTTIWRHLALMIPTLRSELLRIHSDYHFSWLQRPSVNCTEEAAH